MLNCSEQLSEVMLSNRRQILPRAILDLIDPDIVYQNETTSGHNKYSLLPQLRNKVMEHDIKYASVETDRWALDGTWRILPAEIPVSVGEIGYIGNVLSGADGSFESPYPWARIYIAGTRILQGLAVVFTGVEEDGFAVDFNIDVFCGSDYYFMKTVTDNTQTHCRFDGFTVYDPTSIRITFKKWSKPGRYPRAIEIVAGVYEDLYGDMIYSVDIMEETDLSCARLPYDTAVIEIRNDDRRFNPRNSKGVFRSFEERQAMPLFFGVRVPGRPDEYLPRGVYYRQNGGWETSRGGNSLVLRMVSIIGLLANRKFIAPSVLPQTLDGWLRAIVSQLGDSFSENYIIDGVSPDLTLVCSEKDVESITCGTLLRFVCMAAGVYPRADTTTGFLRVAPPGGEPCLSLTLSNTIERPTIKANENIADISFRLNDGENTPYLVGGIDNTSMNTLSVANIFTKTPFEANELARNILCHYGGQRFETVGFGDIRAELGDICNLEFSTGDTEDVRLVKQQFRHINGVMYGVLSQFLPIGDESEFTHSEILTDGERWRAPAGVRRLRIALIGGGAGGEPGEDGNVFDGAGKGGRGGYGGRIFTKVIDINPYQLIYYSIGAGGAAGQDGGETTFSNYSSRRGTIYDGWIDIIGGGIYSKQGPQGLQAVTYNPPPGAAGQNHTGNGGQGGYGGRAATIMPDGLITESPGKGGPGGPGGSGCVILSYNL